MAHELAVVSRQIVNASCIEGDESNLFIGTKDGLLLHYVIHQDDPDSDSLEFTYLLASKQDANGGKSPKSIILLAHVQLAAVLANEVLSFYTLPEFAPASDLRTVKDVRGILLNDDLPSRVEADDSCALTLFTRKKIRQLKVSRSSVRLAKEIEYVGCLSACQTRSMLCVATKFAYELLDIDSKTRIPLFPVVQGEAEPTDPVFKSYRPRIASVSSDEFLVASGSPETPTTMGMFVTKSGEITRGTLMFGAYPWKLCVEYPFVYALLSDRTLEIHDINSQGLVYALPLPGAIGLTKITGSVPVVLPAQLERILLRRNLTGSEEKPALSNLNLARRISDVPTQFLIHEESAVKAVVANSTFVNIDQALDREELQNALAITEILSRESQFASAERLYHEMSYIHQKAAIMNFERMLFDDAADNFNKSNIDPRILISFFPEFDSHAEDANVYAGIADMLVQRKTVDEIIREKVSQNVDDEATLAEVQEILKSNAIELLCRFLTKFRETKGPGTQEPAGQEILMVVEDVLLKLLLQMKHDEVGIQVQDFFNIDIIAIPEVVKTLENHEKWQLLADLHSRGGRHRDALLIWRSMEVGDRMDLDMPEDLISHIKHYLLQYGDNNLISEFGPWLLRRSIPDGLALFRVADDRKLLTSPLQIILESFKSSIEDIRIYLAFLEFLVVDRKANSVDLTDELISHYGNRVVESLANSEVRSATLQSIDEYRLLPVPKVPYLTFVSKTPRMDGHESFYAFNMVRAYFIDLLQGSTPYDASKILQIVLQEKSILLAERILLYGRLSNHQESLHLLVHDLKDFDSAEVYCYHGGISLSQISIYSDKSDTVHMRRSLFPMLFAEILKAEDHAQQFLQGSILLNRWGNYMDIEVVLQLVPDHWSVGLIGEFLTSGLAQLSGEKIEAQIRRSLTRSQLQRTTARAYVKLDYDIQRGI